MARGTYPDIEALPEHLTGELIAGELVVTPLLPPHEAHAATRLLAHLGRSFDVGERPGGWWILHRPEVHLGADVLVPDLAAWRVERMPEIPEGQFELAPDWVCEVLSWRTDRPGRLDKLDVYAREGVRDVWLLNPAARLLEALRLEDGRWRQVGTHGKETEPPRIEPFDAVPIDLRRLWTRKAGE
jgi:Uma2 family endonuclease